MKALPSFCFGIIRPVVRHYHETIETKREAMGIIDDFVGDMVLETEGASWQVAWEGERTDDGGFDLVATFSVKSGEAKAAAVSLDVEFEAWSKRNYVLLPGAVYNGNRFRSIQVFYPPFFHDPDDQIVDRPVTITTVPRLNTASGVSRIQQSTGDPATPAIGCFLQNQMTGFWMLTEQQTRFGNSGLYVEENEDRSRATFSVAAPCVRQCIHRYSAEHPSGDHAADWQVGDSVTLHVRLYAFACTEIQGLFERFFDVRKALTESPRLRPILPLSKAARLIEDHYNRENWHEETGYYAITGARGNAEFQLGWVGGCMQTLHFLTDGEAVSRERAWTTLDTVMSQAPAASGFFKGCAGPDGWMAGSNSGKPYPRNAVLIRKNADGLYFFLKHFFLLRKQGREIPAHWQTAVKGLADAFVTLWQRYGQFGQFVDVESGDIVVGGSTCGAGAMAGLALAADWFCESKYLDVAEAAAEFYYERDAQNGITTGGPGEILQGVDSESCDAMLESFVVLWEATDKSVWLRRAEEMVKQHATWTVSYDYKFPSTSTFGKLDMRATGSVIANIQNKHSAPGMCTLSGDSIFKVFRATGNVDYLELIQETAHNLTQYVSHEDRPIASNSGANLASGWICERVNMSDWERGGIDIGEVFYGSCWPEVTLLLTAIELPGLYVQPDTGLVSVQDNVVADQVECEDGKVTMRLTNPTDYSVEVKVLCETSAQAAERKLGPCGLLGCQVVSLAAGESKPVTFG